MSGYAIAFVPRGPEGEKELETLGFSKQEVWLKYISIHGPDEANREGERIFFSMKNTPLQFYGCTDSWWGAGPE